MNSNAVSIVEQKALTDILRFQELEERIQNLKARTQEIKERNFFQRISLNSTRDLAEVQEENLKIGQDFHRLLQASILFGAKNTQYIKQLSDSISHLEEEQRGASSEYLSAAKELLSELAVTEEDLSTKLAHLASEVATNKARLFSLVDDHGAFEAKVREEIREEIRELFARLEGQAGELDASKRDHAALAEELSTVRAASQTEVAGLSARLEGFVSLAENREAQLQATLLKYRRAYFGLTAVVVLLAGLGLVAWCVR